MRYVVNSIPEQIVADGEQFVFDDTHYPGDWDKSTLPFLSPVTETERPAVTETQIAEDPIVKTNGVWTQTWTVRDMTQDELDAAAPTQVTAFQARMALKEVGVLPTVMAAMAALPVDDNVRIAWDTNAPFVRTFYGVVGMAQQLGLNLPLVFIKAAKY